MFGLLVFGALGIYLVLLIVVTRFSYRWAVKKGWPRGKRWAVAAGGFLLVYLPVFWDHIPTIAAHRYYCAKESGFWVYKTLDQWKAENPGVMETLIANKDAPSTRQGDMQNYIDTYFLNQRINKLVKKNGPFLFNRWRWEQEVVDVKTNEVLARYVDFSTGNGNIGGEMALRFWLQSEHCTDGDASYGKFLLFKRIFQGAEK